MERTGLSSVIKIFSEALCATREKIIQKEDYELKEKKKWSLIGLWNSCVHI